MQTCKLLFMTNTRPYQITAELLSTLRAEGFVLGIGKHLQIQTLLQKLPVDTSDNALKLALIPLLAQSPSEQERLYGIFEDCVKRVNDKELTEEEKKELQKGDEKAQTQSTLRQVPLEFRRCLSEDLSTNVLRWWRPPERWPRRAYRTERRQAFLRSCQ